MRTRRCIAVLVCVLTVSGCIPGSESQTPSRLVRIAIGEPGHLLPSRTTDFAGSQVLAALFSPLIGYDDKNQPREVAAKSVTTTDNLTWTIKLKPGYTFHNGEGVTADNYLDAWNYAAHGQNHQENSYFFARIAGYAALNRNVEQTDAEQTDTKETNTEQADTEQAGPDGLTGLRKVDDLTFKVTLSAPFGAFRAMLGSTAFYPLPKAAFTSPGVLSEDFEKAPVGNGPFRFKGTWRAGEPIEVERYSAYPGTAPKIGGAIFQVYDRPALSYADLVSGTVDVLTQVPATDVADAADDLGDRYQHKSAADLNYLAFPSYEKEFAKPEVRRSISMAIDRDALAESVSPGAQVPARSFVAPVVVGYRKDACGQACQFDPEKARQLYAEAGGPARLRITYNADGGHEAWVDAVCGQLSTNLGVPCAGAAEPTFAAVIERLRDKEPVGMFRMRSMMSYPSMADYLTSLYSTAGAANYFGYRNSRFDRLVREGDAARKPADAIGKYQQAEDLLARDMPVIPLRFEQADFAYSPRVANVDTDPFGRIELTTIELAG